MPEKVQFVLTRSPQEWYNHTRDIYRCYVQDQTFLWLARLQTVSNTASSKRLHYVWTILHKVGGTSAKRSSQLGDFAFGSHYFSHPMPALYCFVLRWLRHTRHGVGCLARCRERTRLTVTISFSRLIVRLQRYEVFSNYRPIIERKIWINLKINTI